jgi:ribose-phosphate pyrophosphokinase
VNEFIIISNVSDDPFAIDIGHMCGQPEEISDIISLKVYANTEFCPRFISDENDISQIGAQLNGKTVVICSAATNHTRGSLAMRNLILARAAKDNGAKKVILVEPDLYFSAQDRGPHRGPDEQKRPLEDIKKFDGQPFTARLYAELLKIAGVDVVITVHNHSSKVQKLFSYLFNGEFHNLIPSDLYADYIRYSDMVVTGKDGDNLVLVAPDHGAEPFMKSVYESLGLSKTSRLIMEKVRDGERKVSMTISKESDLTLEDIKGKDIIVLDDMVRTGSTIVECCRLLRQGAGKPEFEVRGRNPHPEHHPRHPESGFPGPPAQEAGGPQDREMDRPVSPAVHGQGRAEIREGFLLGRHVLQEPALAAAQQVLGGTDHGKDQNVRIQPPGSPRRFHHDLARPGDPALEVFGPSVHRHRPSRTSESGRGNGPGGREP